MNFKKGYSENDLDCPLKCAEKDTQKHLLECDQIPTTAISGLNLPKYDDLFCSEANKQINIGTILKEKLDLRKKMMKLLSSRPMVNQ